MVADRPETDGLPIGYFGASTGAASEDVVSRGGRVDMAGDPATAVDVPCLFTVGSEDDPFGAAFAPWRRQARTVAPARRRGRTCPQRRVPAGRRGRS
ncbi:MAG: hypothetical protein ABEJ73_12880 [Haloplanus sp.]